jgi:hypothetical protein
MASENKGHCDVETVLAIAGEGAKNNGDRRLTLWLTDNLSWELLTTRRLGRGPC